MTLRLVLLCCGIMLTLLPTNVLLGTDRYVSPNGDDLNGRNDCLDSNTPCKTITQAIVRAQNKDSIKVLPGNYDECGLLIDKQLSILAVGFSAVITPNKNLDDPDCKDFVFKFTSSGANRSSLEGFIIRTSVKNDKDAAAVVLDQVTNVTIRKNSITLKRSSDADEKIKAGIGIYVRNSSIIYINDNIINGASITGDGIIIEQSKSYQLSGNRVKQVDSGIVVQNALTSELPDQLFNNYVEGSRLGINIIASPNIELQENTVIGNEQEGIAFNGPCSNIRLIKNKVLNNKRIAIQFLGLGSEFKNVTLLDNIMQNNGGSGLDLGEDITYKQFRIINNVIERNKAGVEIQNPREDSDIELDRNIVKASKGYGIKISIRQTIKNLRLLQNILIGNAKSGLYLVGSNAQIAKNEALANEESGIVIRGDSNMISENITKNNEQSGIVVEQDSKDNTVSANLSHGNAYSGLDLKGYNNHVEGNTLTSNRCFGLVLEASGNMVTANAIQLNGLNCPDTDSFKLKGAAIQINGVSKDNQFQKNKVEQNWNGISISLSESGNPTNNLFQYNQIIRNSQSGIQLLFVEDGASFICNNIVGNVAFGLRNFTDKKVNVQQNWWGDKSGPRHETNPGGKGDRILGPADFGNWLTQPVDINRCP